MTRCLLVLLVLVNVLAAAAPGSWFANCGSKGSREGLPLRAPAKGSALKPGSKGAPPPYLNRTCSMCAFFCAPFSRPFSRPYLRLFLRLFLRPFSRLFRALIRALIRASGLRAGALIRAHFRVSGLRAGALRGALSGAKEKKRHTWIYSFQLLPKV